MKKLILATIVMVGAITTGAYALNGNDQHKIMQNHETMNHKNTQMKGISLTEAGNDAFGTIQEVIRKLESNPNTDWSKVNIEALRKHLADMQDMTLNVEVISQKNIPNGIETVIKATTPRAHKALKRVFIAHPSQLKKETGWDMKVKMVNKNFIIKVTTSKKDEINKIRGLGYIGLMAYGAHHQPHHWMMANGINPHM